MELNSKTFSLAGDQLQILFHFSRDLKLKFKLPLSKLGKIFRIHDKEHQ